MAKFHHRSMQHRFWLRRIAVWCVAMSWLPTHVALAQSPSQPGPTQPDPTVDSCAEVLADPLAVIKYYIQEKTIGDNMLGPISSIFYEEIDETCVPDVVSEHYSRTGEYGEYELSAGVKNCYGGENTEVRSYARTGHGQRRQRILWCFTDCPCPASMTIWVANVFGEVDVSATLNASNFVPFSAGSANVTIEALVEYTGVGRGRAYAKINATIIEGQGGSFTVGLNVGTDGVGVSGSVTQPISGDHWSHDDGGSILVDVGNTLESGCARGKSMTIRGLVHASGNVSNGGRESKAFGKTSFGETPSRGGLTATVDGIPCQGGDALMLDFLNDLATSGLDGCALAVIVESLDPLLSTHELDLLSEMFETVEVHDDFWACVDREALGLPSLEWIHEHGIPSEIVP